MSKYRHSESRVAFLLEAVPVKFYELISEFSVAVELGPVSQETRARLLLAHHIYCWMERAWE